MARVSSVRSGVGGCLAMGLGLSADGRRRVAATQLAIMGAKSRGTERAAGSAHGMPEGRRHGFVLV